jgi:hypothetical protein
MIRAFENRDDLIRGTFHAEWGFSFCNRPPGLYPTAHLGDVRYFGVPLGIARAR